MKYQFKFLNGENYSLKRSKKIKIKDFLEKFENSILISDEEIINQNKYFSSKEITILNYEDINDNNIKNYYFNFNSTSMNFNETDQFISKCYSHSLTQSNKKIPKDFNNNLEKLTNMGFSEENSKFALFEFEFNINRASNFLLENEGNIPILKI